MPVGITTELALALLRAYRPRGYVIDFSTDMSASVNKGSRSLKVPDPFDDPEWCLFRLFHELGHLELKHPFVSPAHADAMPSHREEYEAEQYAFGHMRALGFTVSRDMRDEAKRNVRLAIQRDDVAGHDIDDIIWKWAGELRRGDL